MDIFDEEREIISFFQSLEYKEVAFFPFTDDKSEAIFLSIHSEELWEKWVDSSAHDAPPPDFYNDEMQVMMDVMRVDDHGYKNRKGKTVNPSRQRDTKILQELKGSGIFDIFPNAKPLIISDTGLPTDRDHNYEFYNKNFVRTIEAHKRKIVNYKNNHPEFKLIFFVFDESSMYFSVPDQKPIIKEGEQFQGIPHLWFVDKRFLNTLIGSEIDYLIWYSPYKYVNAFDEGFNPLILPKAVIISVGDIQEALFRNYDESSMISVEQ